MLHSGIDFDFLFTGNESLITRGRNTSAAKFLDTRFEYLMFVDADIEFKAEDVTKLWNLHTELSVGAYALKRKEGGVGAWKDGKLVSLNELDGPVEIDLAGTGFMLIHRVVFNRLKEAHPEWSRREGKVWAFFQDDGCDDSEDYFFCRQWRELGGKVILDPSIKLTHWGQYGY